MAKKQEAKNKVKLLRWRGVWSDARLAFRHSAFGVLAVACIALTFMQSGFVGIGAPGEYAGYAVVLLEPIACAALLLGTLSGFGMGLIAGIALYVHATFLPLDSFELTFVNPFTSIVMLSFAGFLLGIFFAIALRNNRQGARRVLYIAIVCYIVSQIYSLVFAISVIVSFIADLVASVEALGEAGIQGYEQDLIQIGVRQGDMSLQAFVDTVLMTVVCVLVDALARKMQQLGTDVPLRGKFTAWLAAVVAVAFMGAAALGFVAVTETERVACETDLKEEVDYLCNQLATADERADSVINIIDKREAALGTYSAEDLAQLAEALSVDSLMDGYLVESDGLVVITAYDNFVLLSDSPEIERYADMETLFDRDFLSAIDESLKTGRMQRFVFDGIGVVNMSIEEIREGEFDSEIAYLYSATQGNYTVTLMRPSSMVFAARSRVMGLTAIVSAVLLLAVFISVSYLVRKVVVRNIDQTNDALASITAGNLDVRVKADDTLEFKSLATGINNTVDALKGWIAEAETRMDEELATAKAIQEAALPRTFPPFPDILKFDIYASMNPAREVGGDFYDFFLFGGDGASDGNKSLGFVIADVSGKGVPAALFMMKAMTLIRNYLLSGMELGEAVENSNRQLCDGNDSGMFVTAWIGVLNYATGHVDYVNAGHNPPLLWRWDGGWTWLKEKSGLPLGLFDGLPYKAHALDCKVGEQFLLYTDGVTEAMDVNGELFGEERLMDVAGKGYQLHPRELLESVRRSVAEHAKGAEQSDDITILSLEVGVPPELTATLVVPADVDELPRVNEFIHTELDRRLCPKRTQNQLDIAVEELFVNVARYAYPDRTPEKPGMVRISYSYSAEPPSVTIDIADDGIPYDPLAKPDAVTPSDIMEVPIGGLGILMAKRSVNEMHYERIDGSNIVTIVKKW